MGNCVEVLVLDPTVLVRDSKQNDLGESQPKLSATPEQWSIFIAEICGMVEPGTNGAIVIEHVAYGGVVFTSPDSDVRLDYTTDEWKAFVAGVQAGEFGDMPKPELIDSH